MVGMHSKGIHDWGVRCLGMHDKGVCFTDTHGAAIPGIGEQKHNFSSAVKTNIRSAFKKIQYFFNSILPE
jgi:hypothetical protein